MPKLSDIQIRNATLRFQNNILFDDLNLTIQGGKLTCLLGQSGSGKSTLLRLIADIIPFDQKDTHFSGEIFSENISLKNNITYLAQGDILLPWLNALENATLGSRLRGDISYTLLLKTKKLFADVGLQNIEKQYPHQLSGGMRQRVALIRTLVEEKPIVLMDEPFSQLDAITRYELQTLTVELLKNRTVFFVTHDPMEALRISDEIFVLGDKRLHVISNFHTRPPRNIETPEMMKYHAELMETLLKSQKLDFGGF
jgi:putative hydroxymethylpyrimidine transport system ATP-binding protein